MVVPGNSDVLVIPSRDLDVYGVRQGFTDLDGRRLRGLLGNAHWAGREGAEQDEAIRQVIPYVVLGLADQSPTPVLAYWRSAAGSEGRLRGKRSIGFGGHVEPPDDIRRDGGTAEQVIRAAARRELAEEAGLTLAGSDLDFWGVIRDDADPVGRVHLGLVFAVNVAGRQAPGPFGPEVHLPVWVDPADLDPADLENWSRILRRAIIDTDH